MKLFYEGKELDAYSNFYQARVKNNDMLLLKASRPSNLQGAHAQRSVSSNYFPNRQPEKFPFSNPYAQQKPNSTTNQSYGQFPFGNQTNSRPYNQQGSYKQPTAHQPTNRASSMYQNPLPNDRQNSQSQLTEIDLALQKDIERQIHFERMNRNLYFPLNSESMLKNTSQRVLFQPPCCTLIWS